MMLPWTSWNIVFPSCQEISANEIAHMIDTFLETLDEESQVMFVRRY